MCPPIRLSHSTHKLQYLYIVSFSFSHPHPILIPSQYTHSIEGTHRAAMLPSEAIPLTAITTQAKLTYGLSLSPTRAAFHTGEIQYFSLFRSRGPGKVACAYVAVQIVRRITRRRDWKLKSAVYNWGELEEGDYLGRNEEGERGEGRGTDHRDGCRCRCQGGVFIVVVLDRCRMMCVRRP